MRETLKRLGTGLMLVLAVSAVLILIALSVEYLPKWLLIIILGSALCYFFGALYRL